MAVVVDLFVHEIPNIFRHILPEHQYCSKENLIVKQQVHLSVENCIKSQGVNLDHILEYPFIIFKPQIDDVKHAASINAFDVALPEVLVEAVDAVHSDGMDLAEDVGPELTLLNHIIIVVLFFRINISADVVFLYTHQLLLNFLQVVVAILHF